ncbi:MAG: hypothetical protein AB8G11_09155 [Saprospiraceae bacterium]
MTSKEFAAFLESPESDQFSVEQIENMLQQYPYVQSLRIAFLKKLRLSNHPDFEKHLHKTATYAYDRVFLKHYINKEPIYIIEYPAMKVEAEQLETLELMPLDKLQSEKVEHSIFDNIVDRPEQKQQLAFPSDDWEEAVEDDFLDNMEDAMNNIENEVVEETAENVAENEIETVEELIENEVVETVEHVEETAENVAENEIETVEELIENEVVETVEHVEETAAEVVENEIETVEELIENEVIETVEDVETAEEVVENDVETAEELIENEVVETVEDVVSEDVEDSVERTSNLELQNIILESKKMELHAPIEEDIDNLLHEDVLEKLDDEIEFGFEIDKNIINDHDDFSLFDKVKHHHHHDEEHDEEHEHDLEIKPLHQVIHEQINEEKTDDEIDPVKSYEEENNDELSPDNIFSKEELIEQGGLYFLDEIPQNDEPELVEEEEKIEVVKPMEQLKTTLIETEKDPEELPLEEEEEVMSSTKNVDEIRATLFNKTTNKQIKKQQIKIALKRISKIPLSEIEVITETYGNLLAKQGKIEHAIRLYQQLILKNPQKKVYFAAKIKQLIKKI